LGGNIALNAVRKSALLGAAWGVGSGLILIAVYGAWIWYGARPDGWNSEAIAATFAGEDVVGKDRLIFNYVLHNSTRRDYRLADISRIEFMSRLKDPPVLMRHNLGEYMLPSHVQLTELDYLPLFIPAGESVPFSISCFSPYPHDVTNPAGKDPLEYRRSGNMLVPMELKNLKGFVLFDRAARYRIEFPQGW
jgi:hypothetical protein